ncbi:MAG: hypothetical protein ACW99H_13270 [Candidatus Thorarchaeota archaeon]|jgi:hypothetical protein
MDRFSGTIFGLKRVGKYLTDGDLRKAYAEYKESEETALRLIVNTILAEGWIITLSNPRTIEELAKEHEYTNMRLLGDILSLLVGENIVSLTDGKYQIREVKTTAIRPEDVGSAMTNFYYDCSKYLPAALEGKKVPRRDEEFCFDLSLQRRRERLEYLHLQMLAYHLLSDR